MTPSKNSLAYDFQESFRNLSGSL
nr:hypothetical protein [Methanosarcina sp. DH2]